MCVGSAFSSLSHHSLSSSSGSEGTGWQLTGLTLLCLIPESLCLQGVPHVQIQDGELSGKWELCSWALQKCNEVTSVNQLHFIYPQNIRLMQDTQFCYLELHSGYLGGYILCCVSSEFSLPSFPFSHVLHNVVLAVSI